VDESACQKIVVTWSVDKCRRLSWAEGPNLHLRTSESGLAELVELGKISAGLDDVDLGIGTNVYEVELVNLAEERSTLGEGQVRKGDLGRLRGGCPYRVGVADPHPEVWFLEQQPPAGSQPGDYPLEEVQGGGNVHEYSSRVDEIEGAGWEPVSTDVVSKDLDVRRVYPAQKSELQIGSDHASGRADNARKPPGDRPAPATDL
jgi:hypothetical protein